MGGFKISYEDLETEVAYLRKLVTDVLKDIDHNVTDPTELPWQKLKELAKAVEYEWS